MTKTTVMSKKELAQRIASEIRNYLPHDFDNVSIYVEDVPVDNKIETGIIIHRPGDHTDPVLYVDHDVVYDVMKGQASIADIAMEMAKAALNAYDSVSDVDLPRVIADWEKIRNHIRYRVVSAKSKLGPEVLYRSFLDLKITYRLDMEECCGLDASVDVTNGLLRTWGISMETLDVAASENLVAEEFSIDSMRDLVRQKYKGTGSSGISYSNLIPMYVISTRSRTDGSRALLRLDLMKEISERYFEGKDFLILPSVDDLTAVVDTGKEENLKMYTTMVKYVNNHGLKPSNVLADHPYRYAAKSGTISAVLPLNPDSK